MSQRMTSNPIMWAGVLLKSNTQWKEQQQYMEWDKQGGGGGGELTVTDFETGQLYCLPLSCVFSQHFFILLFGVYSECWRVVGQNRWNMPRRWTNYSPLFLETLNWWTADEKWMLADGGWEKDRGNPLRGQEFCADLWRTPLYLHHFSDSLPFFPPSKWCSQAISTSNSITDAN